MPPLIISVREFWRARSRLEKAVAGLLAAVVVVNLAGAAFAGVFEIAAVIAGAILALRYLRLLLGRLMWRLRHRLLITYIFIGVVPVLLLLTMAALAGYLFYAQVATYLVSTRLGLVEEELATATRAAARGAVRETDAAETVRRYLPPGLRNLAVEAQLARESPAWMKETFQGLVRWEDGHVIRAAVPASGGGLLVVTAPMTPELLSRVAAGIGTVRFLELTGPAAERDRSGARVVVGGHSYRLGARRQGGLLPEAQGRFDIAVSGLLTTPAADWNSGPQAAPAVLVVTTRPSLINTRLFSTLGEASGLPLTALAVIAVAFLVIEAVSLWIGVRLTRSITGAVADLYEGTGRVHGGDFSWRIPVRSRDQLAALAESFNTMTASLEQLIREQKEKQRLQSELEIARDVQAQLFPREVPSLGGLELAGTCQPARTVSGDYYDFSVLDNRYLALAIADIAGKGISAALLMASIQSMLHAQLPLVLSRPALEAAAEAERNGHFATASVVTQLNRQLHRSVAPGHFATFCFAVYDDSTGELTYTNAGHLPPIILRGHEVHRLRKGGTVLGVFPGAHYEQETVRLERGDLFVAFTDGVTEPENSYGEEFGEERLLEVLERAVALPPAEIAGAVISAVREWTGSPELQDDMTLLIARRRAL